MPRLNTVGRLAGGIVGGPVSFDFKEIPDVSGDGTGWLDDRRLIYQGYHPDMLAITSYDVAEPAVVRLAPNAGANTLLAAHGRWQARWGSRCHGSWGELGDVKPRAISSDGTLITTNSSGQGITF